MLLRKFAACKTPGKKIKSRGAGRGAGVGGGKGPVGVPLKEKLRAFAKSRKKDKRPSAFIRERMKVGSLEEAYQLGMKTALAQMVGLQTPPLTVKSWLNQLPAMGETTPAPSLKSGAPPAASSGVSAGTVGQ